MNDARLLQVDPADNVLVLVRGVDAGESLLVAGEMVLVETALGTGHKIAARGIAAGEKIIKHGVPIGSATQPVSRGAHVHLHNMKSDYLPTYTLHGGDNYLHRDAAD